MIEHIKSSVSNRPSVFASVLFENHPAYFNWEVEIFTLEECRALLNSPFASLEAVEVAMGDYSDVPHIQKRR
jgi:hypothetical protein